MGEKEWWAIAYMDGQVGRVFQGRRLAMEAAEAYLNQHGGICPNEGCQCKAKMVAAIEAPDDTWGPPLVVHNQVTGGAEDDVTLAMGRLAGPGDSLEPRYRTDAALGMPRGAIAD